MRASWTMSSASAVLPDALMKRRAMASSFPRWTVSVCSISVFVIFCCVVGSFLSGLRYGWSGALAELF